MIPGMQVWVAERIVEIPEVWKKGEFEGER